MYTVDNGHKDDLNDDWWRQWRHAVSYGTCFDTISESPAENPRTVTPSDREQWTKVTNLRTMTQSEQEQRESPKCELLVQV